MNNQTIFWVWLQQALGYASNYLPMIVSKYSFAEDYYSEELYVRLSAASFTPAIKKRLSDTSLDAAKKIIGRCEECGINIVSYADEAYPKSLKEIPNPPAVLYVKGQLSALNCAFCLGMVGTRKADDYGKKTAYELAYELSENGVCIVSGGAAGIDISSHKGALDAKGATVCVLGCGHEAGYLKTFDEIKRKIEINGAVVSEYPPDVTPTKYTFPIRNRIISGLSRGVIVVEAGEKSGSLITVDYAEKQGKDIFAVPGSADNKYSEGTNALIKDGAIPVTKASDIFCEYRNKSASEESDDISDGDESLDTQDSMLWRNEPDAHDPMYDHGKHFSKITESEITKNEKQMPDEPEESGDGDEVDDEPPGFIIIKELVGRFKIDLTPDISFDPDVLEARHASQWLVDLARQYQLKIAQGEDEETRKQHERVVEAYMKSKASDTREISLLDLKGKDKERFGYLLEQAKEYNIDLTSKDPIYIYPPEKNSEEKELTNTANKITAGTTKKPKEQKMKAAENKDTKSKENITVNEKKRKKRKTLVTEKKEIIKEKEIKKEPKKPLTDEALDGLSSGAKKFLEVLGDEIMHIDNIALKSGLPISEINAAATELEIFDLVESLEGRRYKIRN